MAYTRNIDARLINMTSNKNKVLACLTDAMVAQGLEGNEIIDLIPDAETEKGKIISVLNGLGLAGRAASFVFSSTSRLLKPFRVELGSAEKTLFERYEAAWIKELQVVTKKSTSKIKDITIKSNRIFISELYLRCFAQAVRTNGNLTPGKERQVWVGVMQGFTERLLSSKHVNAVKLDDGFRRVITTLNVEWVKPLIEIIRRIEDLNRANSVIRQNLNYLEELGMHVKRFLLVELVGKSGAKTGDWSGSVSTATTLNVALEESEKKWIEKNKKTKKEVAATDQASMPFLTELMQSGALSSRQAERQIQICKLGNARIKELYGLKNWTDLLIGMVTDIDQIIRIGGWIPLFLEGMHFEAFDKFIADHKRNFDQLMDIKFLASIEGTKLERALLEHVNKIAAFDIRRLIQFQKLENRELLERIGEEFVKCIMNLINRGVLLGSPIVTPQLIQTTRQFVPALPSSTSAFAITQRRQIPITARRNPFLPIDEKRAVHIEEVDETAAIEAEQTDRDSTPLLPMPIRQQRKQDDSNFDMHSVGIDDFMIKEEVVMQTRYIEEHFRIYKKWTQLNKLFSSFLVNPASVKFLTDFDNDGNFSNASKLVTLVRGCVKKFITDVFSLEPVEPRTGAVYWRIRREELFCLKYLCVESFRANSDAQLLSFIKDLDKYAYRAFGINIFSRRFNILIDGLRVVLETVYRDKSMELVLTDAPVSPSVIEALATKDRELREKDLLISDKDQIIEKFKTENQELKSRIGTLELEVRENREKVATQESKTERLNKRLADIERRLPSERPRTMSRETLFAKSLPPTPARRGKEETLTSSTAQSASAPLERKKIPTT
jgi:hypothetical protein